MHLLSSKEIKWVDSLLARTEAGPVPCFDAFDGFLTALACYPEQIEFHEIMSLITKGGSKESDLKFQDEDELTKFLDIFKRHLCGVHKSFEGDTSNWAPRMNARRKIGMLWAQGFMTCTKLREDVWVDMAGYCEEALVLWCGLLALATENYVNPKKRLYQALLKKRRDLLFMLAAEMPNLYEYFSSERDNETEHYKPSDFEFKVNLIGEDGNWDGLKAVRRRG